MSRFVLAVAFAITLAPPVLGQSFSFGADFVSRYVWRGYDFGESASIQPSLSYTYAGTEVGTWASYALVPDGALANEHDLWVAHTMDVGGSAFTVGLNSYYFPNAGPDFFDLDNDGEGAHYLEPFIGYEGDEGLPLTLYASIFAYNDPDRSIYLEAGYPFDVAGTALHLAAGFLPAVSALYGTEGPALTNLSFSASRDLPISDRFALPLSVTYVLNPYAERSYLVFGVSLHME